VNFTSAGGLRHLYLIRIRGERGVGDNSVTAIKFAIAEALYNAGRTLGLAYVQDTEIHEVVELSQVKERQEYLCSVLLAATVSLHVGAVPPLPSSYEWAS
jgi:hypothetical protein